MQTRIFEPAPPGSRKCVVATNIAEASLTIDGIYYGSSYFHCFSHCSACVQSLTRALSRSKFIILKWAWILLLWLQFHKHLQIREQVVPVVPVQAKHSVYIRSKPIVTCAHFGRLITNEIIGNEMLPTSVPEIQRTNLGHTVLMLKALGINNLLGFDFMDPPPVQAMVAAMENLYALGALDDEGIWPLFRACFCCN